MSGKSGWVLVLPFSSYGVRQIVLLSAPVSSLVGGDK